MSSTEVFIIIGLGDQISGIHGSKNFNSIEMKGNFMLDTQNCSSGKQLRIVDFEMFMAKFNEDEFL